jgi:cation efflux system protein involved in nickel and cobalt tolerance
LGYRYLPIFALTGVEGSIFIPMGLGYLAAVLASSVVALTVTPALCAILLPYGSLPEREPWVSRFFKEIYHWCLMFALRRAKQIVGFALASLVMAAIIVPNFGRIFLPEFQERSLVNTLLLYPGSSLAATNIAASVVESKLKGNPNIRSIQMRSGRVAGDADAAGVKLTHLDVELSDKGMEDRPATIEIATHRFW